MNTKHISLENNFLPKSPIFGAAYYAEYMPYERIEKDFSLMKQAGMNTIRIAESTWSTEEPNDNVFDFSYVDSVLECAEKYDIRVIIGTPTYAIPPWLAKKHPEFMLTTRQGQIKYGPRQSIDFLNPDFKFYAERIIRKLVSRTAGHKAVIGFQLDNETKHFNNYGKTAQVSFKEYLKTKFSSPEEFSRAFTLAYWSNSISSWDDLPDLSNCINGNLLCEYESFLRKCAADYLAWQAKIVSEYKSENQFITHNFDYEWRGFSFGVQPQMNHFEAAKYLDIAGCDIYHPSQDLLTGSEIAFGGDSARGLKNAPYIVLETQAQGFKEWTPYPGQLRLLAYSHLSSGALGLMYWNWHSIHNSFETYWKGVLSHDLLPGEVYNEAAKIGGELKRLGNRIAGLSRKNKVAILTDNNSLSALSFFPMDEGFSYNDAVRFVYDALYRLNIGCDVIDVNAVNPEKYAMIVTPALYCIDEPIAEKLRDFVSGGGVLFSTFRSFYADSKGSAHAEKAPFRLTDVFGMHYSQITQGNGIFVEDSAVSHYAELLEAEENCVRVRYNHPFWKKYAAITRNQFGKGKSWYFGAHTEPKALERALSSALSDAEISLPAARFPIIVRGGENQNGEQIDFFLNYSGKSSSYDLPSAEEDLLSGEIFERGKSIELEPWGVRVLLKR